MDHLYISDSLNHRVQKFTKDGKFLGKWGELGDGPGQLNMPWGVTLDGQGDVFVADWRNDRIQKFDHKGRFLQQWPHSESGPGNGAGQLNRPSGLAVDSEGLIYVCDWANERVQVLSPSGESLASIRGDSVTSTWATDYFQANPDEGAARLRANLDPEVNPRGEYNREVSANIEKLLWGPTAVKLDGGAGSTSWTACATGLQVYRKGA